MTHRLDNKFYAWENMGLIDFHLIFIVLIVYVITLCVLLGLAHNYFDLINPELVIVHREAGIQLLRLL